MSLSRYNELSYGHFVTSRTFHNKNIFRDNHCCRILLRNIDYYRKKLVFQLLGYVIMPDHVHLIMYLGVDKYPKLTISKVMHGIKGLSAQNISNYLTGSRGFYASTSSQGAKALAIRGERRIVIKIWQSSFYDFNIYSEEKLREKLNYIHYNPVRAGLCKKPEYYKWSSDRFYQFGEKGIIKIDRL